MSSVRIVTVTVSDTRTPDNDATGRALAAELQRFKLVRHLIVRDEPDQIRKLLREIARDGADAIVCAGGTGIASRDQTFEALQDSFDKELPGFGEAFRRLSWVDLGPRAILSRAVAGTIGACIVFSLPGSERAARLGARELIVPVLDHAIDLLRGHTEHHGHHAHGALTQHDRA